MPLTDISESTGYSLDQECYLVSVSYSSDELHRQEKQSQRSFSFCAELPIHSGEFFRAAQLNIRPEKLLMLNSEDYSGESQCEYGGTLYRIYRTYSRSDGMTELYLQMRSGE